MTGSHQSAQKADGGAAPHPDAGHVVTAQMSQPPAKISPQARIARWHLLFGQGKFAEALEEAVECIAAKPAGESGKSEYAKTLLKLDRAPEAEAFLVGACKMHPTAVQLWSLLAETRMATGAVDAALEAIDSAARLKPNDPRYGLQKAAMLESAGRIEAAVDLLAALELQFPKTVRAPQVAADLYARLDRWDEAIAAAARAAELAPDDIRIQIRAVELMMAADRMEDAYRHLAGLGNRFPGHVRIHQMAAELHAKLSRWDEAAAAAQKARELSPADVRVQNREAELLMAAGRAREAFEASQRVDRLAADPKTKLTNYKLMAKAAIMLDDEPTAIDALLKAASLPIQDLGVMERLLQYHEEQGLSAEQSPVFEKLQKLHDSELPPTLASGLHALWAEAEANTREYPGLAWAWEFADQTSMSFKEFRVGVIWGQLAQDLVKRWWRWAPERSQELLDLVDRPDLTQVRAAIAGGQGCLLVCAHIGAYILGGFALANSGFPCRAVAFSGGLRAAGVDNNRIVVTDNVRASTRNILQPLRNGTVIAWTVDSMVGDTYSVDFLGRELRLNAMAPRIAQRHASASFWCYPHWRGERVAFEIERLPEPRDGEDADSWAARWYAPYLDKLEQVVRGDPRNITTRFLTWREPNPDTSFGVRRTLIKTATTRPLAVRRGPEGWTPG